MCRRRILVILLLLGVVLIPVSVSAVDDQENDIMITVKTNKDVDELMVNSERGDFTITPYTTYGDEDIRGNNQVMDMNGDRYITQKDKDILQAHLDGSCKDYTATVRCSHCGAADINGDEKIDNQDMKLLNDHLSSNCKLDDCYFHGVRELRKETSDGYTWEFHYTPIISGWENMTYTPISQTSTGERKGESQTFKVHSEEYKNPEILTLKVTNNQNKWLINTPITFTVTTPLETDQVIFNTPFGELLAQNPKSINYLKNEKTWERTYTPTSPGIKNIVITGQGEQSNDTFLNGNAVNIYQKIVDPQVLSTSSSTVTHTHVSYSSSTDKDGNVSVTTSYSYTYTITVTAITNLDTDYVIFNTPNGSVTCSSGSTGTGTKSFSTSWTSSSSDSSASAQAFATITSIP